MIQFFAPGIPAAQGSKVFLGKGRSKESNPHLKSWRSVIAGAWPAGEPMLEGPIKLDALFLYPRPKAHYGRKGGVPYLKPTAPAWKASAPDADKLLRAALDALTGIAYRDDAQVAQVSGSKGFTEKQAGVLVTISTIEPS